MGSWRPRPKSMTEKGYRKYMARQKTVRIYGRDFRFQSVSPQWYYDNCDEYGIYSGGRRDTAGYTDSLLRNTVVSPPEVKVEGIEFFADDRNGGFGAQLKVVSEIEKFLQEPVQSESPSKGQKES